MKEQHTTSKDTGGGGGRPYPGNQEGFSTEVETPALACVVGCGKGSIGRYGRWSSACSHRRRSGSLAHARVEITVRLVVGDLPAQTVAGSDAQVLVVRTGVVRPAARRRLGVDQHRTPEPPPPEPPQQPTTNPPTQHTHQPTTTAAHTPEPSDRTPFLILPEQHSNNPAQHTHQPGQTHCNNNSLSFVTYSCPTLPAHTKTPGQNTKTTHHPRIDLNESPTSRHQTAIGDRKPPPPSDAAGVHSASMYRRLPRTPAENGC